MLEILLPHFLQAALGLVLGALLGLVACRGRFCTLGAVEDAVYARVTRQARACGNTITTMERTEGRKLELLPDVGVVRAGAVRLVTLQEADWSYLRV